MASVFWFLSWSFSFTFGFLGGFFLSLTFISLFLFYIFFDLTGVRLLFQTKLIRILIFFARIFDKFISPPPAPANSEADASLSFVIHQYLDKIQALHEAQLRKYRSRYAGKQKNRGSSGDADGPSEGQADNDEDEKVEEGEEESSAEKLERKLRSGRRAYSFAATTSTNSSSSTESNNSNNNKETFVWLNTFLQHAFREFVLKNNERIKFSISHRISQMLAQSHLNFLVGSSEKEMWGGGGGKEK